MPAQTVIKIRRDTQANWGSVNPVLAAGEIAFETDTSKIKVGDGTSTWSQLDYASGAGTAAEITTDTTNFDGLLSGSDTTVQAALETLDDLDISAGVITSDSPPSSPSNGDLWWESSTGNLYIYFDSYWVQVQLGEAGPQGESGVLAVDSPITYDAGTSTVGLDGYVFKETVYFTSSGTFSKGDYPWLKAMRVKVQGAGGGSGKSAATSAGQSSCGGGGAAGAYAESFITDISSLSSSITVTVGSGGDGATLSPDTTSGTGGSSSFGSGESFEVSAGGGAGGEEDFRSGLAGTSSSPNTTTATGDRTFEGMGGNGGFLVALDNFRGGSGGQGGHSVFGFGGAVSRPTQNSKLSTGFGAGGSGAANPESRSGKNGRDGLAGVIIVELFA